MMVSNGNIHVIPDSDAVAHEDNHHCPCGPQWELLREIRACGHLHTAWLFTHHSADGREAHE